jgi:hypothetical protein
LACVKEKVDARVEGKLTVGVAVRTRTNDDRASLTSIVDHVYSYEHTVDTMDKGGGVIARTEDGWFVRMFNGPLPRKLAVAPGQFRNSPLPVCSKYYLRTHEWFNNSILPQELILIVISYAVDSPWEVCRSYSFPRIVSTCPPTPSAADIGAVEVRQEVSDAQEWRK